VTVSDDAVMDEVFVPAKGDSWASGYLISDWAEAVLAPSNNLRLKSATVEARVANLFD
jgi:hypothetical protein